MPMTDPKAKVRKKWLSKRMFVVTLVLIGMVLILLACVFVLMPLYWGYGGVPYCEAVGFKSPQKVNERQWLIEILDVNPYLVLSKVKVQIRNGTTAAIADWGLSGIFGDTLSKKYTASGNTLTVTFTDMNDDKKLGGDDYFTFTFSGTPAAGVSYTMDILLTRGSWPSETTRSIGNCSFTV